jgi:hypothetical protein
MCPKIDKRKQTAIPSLICITNLMAKKAKIEEITDNKAILFWL